MHICICVYVYIYISLSLSIYIYIYMYTCTYVYIYILHYMNTQASSAAAPKDERGAYLGRGLIRLETLVELKWIYASISSVSSH